MRVEASDLVVGAFVAILGIVGLFLASGALDDEIFIFGLGLAGFAVVFDIGLVRRHFDRADVVRVAARPRGDGND